MPCDRETFGVVVERMDSIVASATPLAVGPAEVTTREWIASLLHEKSIQHADRSASLVAVDGGHSVACEERGFALACRTMHIVGIWLRAFVLTCAIEIPVAYAMFRSSTPHRRLLATAFVAQILTHPAVWFLIPLLHLQRFEFLAVAEGWAWVAEAVFYWLVVPTSLRRALGVSALANGLSWAVGTLLRDAFTIAVEVGGSGPQPPPAI